MNLERAACLAQTLLAGPMVAGVIQKKEQFDPVRNSQFFEHTEQVVLYRMLAELQLRRNLPIALPLRGEFRYFHLPLGQAADFVVINAVPRRGVPDACRRYWVSARSGPNFTLTHPFHAVPEF